MTKVKKNDDDFFSESEIKKTDDLTEEMDTSFVEPKHNHFFGIFLLILLILTICGGITYFFMINTPQKLYVNIFNKLIDNNDYKFSLNNKLKDTSINYKLGFNITTENKDLKETVDVINKITITGTNDTYKDKNIIENNATINYKNEELTNLIVKSELDNNVAYLSINNIFDKVIKFSLQDESDNKESNKDTEKDYEIITKSILKAVSVSLENAKYKREFLKLNDKYVKKQTIVIDSSFAKTFYTKLLQDEEFLTSVSNITEYNIEKISDTINKRMNELTNNKESLSIYSTIIKDEFIKLEYKSDGDSLIITKNANKYNFELTEDYTLKYQGFIKESKENNSNITIINIDLIEEKIIFEITIESSKNKETSKLLDTSSSINYKDLTEEDKNKIINSINENKNIISLLNDLGINDYISSPSA